MRYLFLFLFLFAALFRGSGVAYVIASPNQESGFNVSCVPFESAETTMAMASAAAAGDMGAMVEMAGQKATEKALGKATEATGSALNKLKAKISGRNGGDQTELSGCSAIT